MTNEATLEMRIHGFAEFVKAESFVRRVRFSSPTFFHGLVWKIYVKPCYQLYDKARSKTLKFFLWCKEGVNDPKWKCRASTKFHIISQKESVIDNVREVVHNFKYNFTTPVHLQTVRCAVLLDPNNGFIKDDTVIFRANVKVEMLQGVQHTQLLNKLSSLSLDPPDGILFVENKAIPIHKMYLAFHSEYFNTMFQSKIKEARQSGIVLEDVTYAEMIQLLSVIYPMAAPITNKNIKSILKLARRYRMPTLMNRCMDSLRNSTKIRRVQKLLLAQLYNFSDLQLELAQQYKTIEDAKELKSEPEYELLDNNTLGLVFKSIF